MFAVPSFFGYNTTFVSTPVATAATGVGQTSFTANWNSFAGASYYLLDVSTSSSFSSFVGSYQNFVVLSTSQLVSGLTASTTYYYRLRAATGVDADAAAFFSRVYTAGGALSYTEVSATETLVSTMKADGTWTPMKAIYPMVGASAAACAQNLKSASFTGAFSSGVTYASSGVTFNGATGYMDSNFNANTNFSLTSFSFGGYSSTTVSSSGYYGASVVPYLIHSFKSFNFVEYFTPGPTTYDQVAGGVLGMVQANYVGTTSKLFTNNTLGASGTGTVPSLPNLNMYIGAINSSGSPMFYDNHLVSYYYYADGLTDTQASNHYTAVQTFQTTLNRSVGTPIVSDADAQAYINRVYTAGGTLTNTEATAVNQLTIDMKAANVWTPMKAIYPMVGASAAACAQNLKSSSFTGTFTSGWTFASTGVTPNGTSAFFDTAFNTTTNQSVNNLSLSAYIRTSAMGTGAITDMGNWQGGTARPLTNLQTNTTTRDIYCWDYIGVGSFTSTSTADASGMWGVSRSGASSWQSFQRNTSVSQTGITSQTTVPNNNVYIGAANGNGTATEFTSRQIAFAHLGDSLSNTQFNNFYTAVQAFQVSLSRSV
jgi:hypothetical protein